jgi:chromosomal replication initiation ATPase DnaA
MSPKTQFALDLGYRPALGREDFLVAPCNGKAVAWLDRWPDWPGPGLIVWGPPGSGKTHLAQVFAERTGAHTVSMEEIDEDLGPRLMIARRSLVVENVDGGVAEEVLLHLYNTLAEHEQSLLIIARTPPAQWKMKLADLRSRLLALPSVEVEAPDDALLTAVLVKLFADRQLKVSKTVIAYAVTHMERSFAAARDLVAAADDLAMAEKSNITVSLIKKVIK